MGRPVQGARGRLALVAAAIVLAAAVAGQVVVGPAAGSALLARPSHGASWASLPLPAVRALSAGADQTCALLADGGVDCWGANSLGQLGDGSSGGPAICNGDPCSPVAVAVQGLGDATAISAGGGGACALRAGGGVDCWGANSHGQLGDGSDRGPQSCDGDPCSRVPVPVRGVSGATAVAVGGEGACALLAGGAVDCWGANSYGQLGDGSDRGPQSCDGEPCSRVPVAVRGVSGATAVAVGGEGACALLSGGSVECWGANGYGQLGDDTSGGPQSCAGEPCSPVAVAVDGLRGATAIAAGNDHACALLAGGGVDCWGFNFAAELGTGTSSGPQWCADGEWCSTKPVAVFGMASAVSIVAGGDHTCVLVAAGAVQCWGYNSYGQLGDGQSGGPQTCYWQLVRCAKTPVAVSPLAGANAVAAGGEHTCALLLGAGVECWGANWFGDLGDGSRSGPEICNGYPCSAMPVAVSRAPD